MSKFLWASLACDLILNASKRLCTTRHQHPWAFDRSPFNRGMPLHLYQVTPLLITSTTALCTCVPSIFSPPPAHHDLAYCLNSATQPAPRQELGRYGTVAT